MIETRGTVTYAGRGRYIRQLPGRLADGSPAWFELAGPGDVSPRFGGYDAACSACWVGMGHSVAAHEARTTCTGRTS
jgi:hypothetical protein